MNMTWNHRVMNCPSENDGDDNFTFREVYYKEDGTPFAHGEAFMSGDTVEELHMLVRRLKTALGEPVMHENEFEKELK